ncbi:MAG: Uma2 family endonuclease [Myxococcota bacterium]
MHAPRPALVSEEAFLALPATMEKVELLDGEVIVAPAPSLRHQTVLKNLVFALETWARAAPLPVTVGLAPIDVRFAPGRILQPDAFVALERLPLDVHGPIDRIPELCIEVLSTDRVMDRVTKRLIYAAAGVREYWVVEQSGVVEQWTGDGLAQARDVVGTLTSALLPGFSLETATLAS